MCESKLLKFVNSLNNSTKKKSKKCKKKKVYGEFIRTFTFSGAPQLPIVQPGGSLVFPVPTVPPVGVQYVEDTNRVGLLVPGGIYTVSWTVNPSTGASITLLVNGQAPVIPIATTGEATYPYTKSVTTGPIDVEFLVRAPLKNNNLISLVNSGTSLFSLGTIANTAIGNTSVLTRIRIKRIDN